MFLFLRAVRDFQIAEIRRKPPGQFRHRARVPETHGNARGVGRKPQHEEAGGFVILGIRAAFHRLEQGRDQVGQCVGIVFGRFLKKARQFVFKVTRFVRPKYRGGVAHPQFLGGILAEQGVEGGGVGEGSRFADRRILALFLAERSSGSKVERDDIAAGRVRALHALDGVVQRRQIVVSAGNEANVLRCRSRGRHAVYKRLYRRIHENDRIGSGNFEGNESAGLFGFLPRGKTGKTFIQARTVKQSQNCTDGGHGGMGLERLTKGGKLLLHLGFQFFHT